MAQAGAMRARRQAGTPLRFHILGAALIVAFLLQALFSIRDVSVTTDENVDIAAGYSYWKTRDSRMNIEHPPLVKMLETIPLLSTHLKVATDDPSWPKGDEGPFTKLFRQQNGDQLDRVLFRARVAVVALGALLAVYVQRWATALWGPAAGLAALFLFVFDPNILANSALATLDMGLTTFTFISMYYLWKWLNSGAAIYAALSSVSLGLSLVSKFPALALLPIFFAEFLLHRYTTRRRTSTAHVASVTGFLCVVVGSVLVVVAFYGIAFNNWRPLVHPGGDHRSIRAVVAHVPFVNGLQTPIIALGQRILIPPVAVYREGLRVQQSILRDGYPGFLMGHVSYRGWWYYYALVFLMKTSTPVLLLLTTRFVILPWLPAAGGELFIIVPIAVTMILSCFSPVARGVQYILPLYPFLFVGLSRVIALGISGSALPSRTFQASATHRATG